MHCFFLGIVSAPWREHSDLHWKYFLEWVFLEKCWWICIYTLSVFSFRHLLPHCFISSQSGSLCISSVYKPARRKPTPSIRITFGSLLHYGIDHLLLVRSVSFLLDTQFILAWHAAQNKINDLITEWKVRELLCVYILLPAVEHVRRSKLTRNCPAS